MANYWEPDDCVSFTTLVFLKPATNFQCIGKTYISVNNHIHKHVIQWLCQLLRLCILNKEWHVRYSACWGSCCMLHIHNVQQCIGADMTCMIFSMLRITLHVIRYVRHCIGADMTHDIQHVQDHAARYTYITFSTIELRNTSGMILTWENWST